MTSKATQKYTAKYLNSVKKHGAEPIYSKESAGAEGLSDATKKYINKFQNQKVVSYDNAALQTRQAALKLYQAQNPAKGDRYLTDLRRYEREAIDEAINTAKNKAIINLAERTIAEQTKNRFLNPPREQKKNAEQLSRLQDIVKTAADSGQLASLPSASYGNASGKTYVTGIEEKKNPVRDALDKILYGTYDDSPAETRKAKALRYAQENPNWSRRTINVTKDPLNRPDDIYEYRNDPDADRYISESFARGNEIAGTAADTVRVPAWVTNTDWYKSGAKSAPVSVDDINRFLAEGPEDSMARSDYLALKAMSEDEQKEYSYILGKYGKEKAQAYLDTRKYGVVNEEAMSKYNKWRNAGVPGKIVGGIGMAAGSGFENVIRGYEQFENALTRDETLAAPSATQEAYRRMRGDVGDAAGFGLDLIQNATQMAPTQVASLVAAAATGGMSAAPELFGLFSTMFPMATGSAYEEAMIGGADSKTAQKYAVLEGLNEAGGEFLLGGIEGVGGGFTKRYAETLLNGVAGATPGVVSTTARALSHLLSTPEGRYAFSALTEGFEEIVQGTVENVLKNGVLGANEDLNPFNEENLYSALVAGFSTLISNSPNAIMQARTGANMEVNPEMLREASERISPNQTDYIKNGELDTEAYEAAMEEKEQLLSQAEYMEQGHKLTPMERAEAAGAAGGYIGRANAVGEYITNNTGAEDYANAADNFVKDIDKYSPNTQQKAQALREKALDLSKKAETNSISRIEATNFATEVNEFNRQKYGEKIKMETINLERDFGKEGAALYKENIKAQDEPYDYYKAFSNVYNSGAYGWEISKENQALVSKYFNSKQVESIYTAGLNDNKTNFKNAMRRASRAMAQVGKEVKGNVTYDFDESTMTREEQARVATWSNLLSGLGFNVHWYSSEFDEQGNIKPNKKGELNPNGSYTNSTNTITLDLHAGQYKTSDQVMLNTTISHELTHWMEIYNPKMYETIKNTVLNTLALDKDYKYGNTIQEIIENERRRAGGGRSDAEHELVARACEDMLSGSTVAKKALQSLDPNTKKTILDHVRDTFKTIQKYFNNLLSAASSTEEAEAIRRNKKAMKEIQKTWEEILQSGYEAQASAKSLPTTEVAEEPEAYETQFSKRQLAQAMDLDVLLNIEGDVIDIVDPKTGKPVRNVTMNQVKETPMGSMIDAAVKAGSLSPGKAIKQLQMFTDLINLTMKFEPGSLPMVWESVGSSLFSSIKDNADKQYSTTVDYGTICAKTQALINVLSNVMVKRGRGLTREEVMIAYNETAKNDLQVPCPVCYVFSRWMGVPSLLDNMRRCQERFSNLTEEGLQKYLDSVYEEFVDWDLVNEPNKSKRKSVSKQISERKTKTQGRMETLEKNLQQAVDKKDDAKIKKISKEAEALQEELDKLESYAWVTQVRCIETGENQYKLDPGYSPVKPEILFNLDRSGDFASQFPKAWKYRTTRGAGMGKAILPYSGASIGDFIKGTKERYADGKNPFINKNMKDEIEAIKRAVNRAKAQNLIGGQRFQSTSDFRAEWGVDYLMTLQECQIANSQVQLYTKVIEAVDMLASAGCECNLSIMPKDNGYITNAKGEHELVFSNVTGIDFDAAYEKVKKYDNVQMILVGISDEHIRLAMADDRIGFIIPWHSSGNSKDTLMQLMSSVGENLDVEENTDYSKMQDDKIINDSKEMVAMRNFRKDILMANLWENEDTPMKLTDEQKQMLSINPYLADLYRRFYLDKTAQEYHVKLNGDQASKIFPYEYWDKTSTLDNADINGYRFQEYCASLGIKPRFSGLTINGEVRGDFTKDKGYWKLLIDRSMYNVDGTYHNPQAIDVTNVKIESLPLAINNNTYMDGDRVAQATMDTLMALDGAQNDLQAVDDISTGEITEEDEASDDYGEVEYSHRVTATEKLPGTDIDLLDYLNEQIKNGQYITTYKAFLKVGDQYYSPMATFDKDEEKKQVMRTGVEIHEGEENDWLASDGNLSPRKAATMPIKINPESPYGFYYGDYNLVKGNEEGEAYDSIKASYNPYQHSSDLVINDQFATYYKRPGIVVVECRIPMSEIENPYWAPFAKNPTGKHDWKSGMIAGQLENTNRSVYMTRYIQPVRVLSNREVAEKIRDYIQKEEHWVDVHFNDLHPEVAKELEKMGIVIDQYGDNSHIKEGTNNPDRFGNTVPLDLRDRLRAEREIRSKARKKRNESAEATARREKVNAERAAFTAKAARLNRQRAEEALALMGESEAARVEAERERIAAEKAAKAEEKARKKAEREAEKARKKAEKEAKKAVNKNQYSARDIEAVASDPTNDKVIRQGSDKDIQYSTRVTDKNINDKLKVSMATFFSGTGTVDFALRNIVRHEFAVEYDAKIAAVYRANNGDNIYVDDVRNVDINPHKGKVEYFHASPVCKSYSNANNDQGEKPLDIETARATADAIDTLQPKVVTVENVAKYRNSEAIKLIEDALERNGYKFDKGVYRASDFGGATIRERMFLRAVKDGVLPEIDTSEYEPMTWYEAVEDLIPNLPKAEFSDYMEDRLDASGIDIDNLEMPIFILGGEKSGKLTWAAADRPAPTILTKSTEAKIVMPDGRVLRATPRVMARIQGLPDSFDLKDGKGGMTNAYKVVGNGVPTQLTQGIVGPLLEQNLIKSKSESLGIQYSARDTEYMDAVKSHNIEAAQKMVDEAAKDAGYSLERYHGTKAKFNTFDPERMKFGNSGYGYYFGDRDRAAQFGGDDMIRVYVKADKLATKDTNYITPKTFKAAMSRLGISPSKTYKRYTDTLQEYLEYKTDWQLAYALQEWAYWSDTYGIKKNQKRMPANEILSILMDTLGIDGTSNKYETVLWDNRLIKSADPVTYDDNGNVIPLSERFDNDDSDIRYSTRNVDDWLDELSLSALIDELVESQNEGAEPAKRARAERRVDQAKKRLAELGLSFNGTKTLGWTDERIEKYLDGNHFGSSNPKYAQAYIAYISPSEFLNLTVGSNERTVERLSDETSGMGDVDLSKLDKDYLQPMFLTISDEKATRANVIGHEGRHRMILLGKAGFERVPVLVFNSRNKYDKQAKAALTLKPENQTGGFISRTREVMLRDLIPFSSGNAETIKERFGPAATDTQYSMRGDYAPTFYSKLQREIGNFKGDKIGAASVESYLKGKGIKDEEIKWSGIRQYLEGKKSVGKQELMDYLKANELVIETKELTGESLDTNDQEQYFEAIDVLNTMTYDKLEEMGLDPFDTEYETDLDNDVWTTTYTDGNGKTHLLASLNTKGTNWSEYKLDGGENYREILFRMPNSDYSNDAMRVHWKGDTGVLAHARVQDFDAEDGGKVLFIEEIQSDWHNAGQKHGYIENENELKQKKQAINNKLDVLNKEFSAMTAPVSYQEWKQAEAAAKDYENGDYGKVIREFKEYYDKNGLANVSEWTIENGLKDRLTKVSQELHRLEEEAKSKRDAFRDWEKKREENRKQYTELSRKLSALNNGTNVPDAPFRDSYTSFVLKDLLRMAAEGDYDYLAWTTGKMQEDRWSDIYSEGYRIEYDQDIPKFLKKYGKQWGAGLQDIKIYGGWDPAGNAAIVPAIVVNDAMKESVLYAGQPMFSQRNVKLDNELQTLVQKYGALPKGEKPVRDISVPEQTSDGKRVRKYVGTVLESGITSDMMDDEIKEKILKEGLSYEPVTDESAAEYAASVLRIGGTARAQKEWDKARRSDTFNKDHMALGQELLREYAKQGDIENAVNMVTELAAEGTRMGQNIQAMRMLKKYATQCPAVGLGYIQSTVDIMNREAKAKMGKRYKEMVIDPQLAEEYVNAKTQDEIDAVLGKIYKNLGSQVQKTVGEEIVDRLRAWRYSAMLGNPRTHVRNLVGNALFVPAVAMKNAIGATIESAVGTETRTKSLTVSKAARQFAAQDAIDMRDVLQGNADKPIRQLIMDERKTFTTPALNTFKKLNGDALEYEDWIFLRYHYQNSLAQYITANKLDVDDLDGKDLAKARQYAVKEAQKATYRDANRLSTWLNQSKEAGPIRFIMEGMLPFKKTPTNILRRGIEYSPAMLVLSIKRGIVDLNQGKITVNEWIDGLASGLTGTAIFGLGMFLASTGAILGGYKDDDDKDKRKLKGEQEYAVKIGNHTYTIDWAAPAALPLFVGVETMYARRADGSLNFDGIAKSAAKIVDPMINLSMLSGLNDTLDAISYSDSKLSAIAEEAFFSLLGQFVPTILGQAARTIDTTQRINYQDVNTGMPKNLLYFVEKMQNKIPYMTFSNDPYLDAFGRENTTESRFIAALQNFVFPWYTSKLDDDRVVNTVTELQNNTEESVIPKKMPKYIGQGEDRMDLTSAQYTQFQRTAGTISYNVIDSMIDDDRYNSLNADEQASAIKMAYEYAKAVGRLELQPDYELKDDAKKVYEGVQDGRQAYDVILTQTMTKLVTGNVKGDPDENGKTISGTEKVNKMKAILDSKGTVSEKAAMFESLYPDDKVYAQWKKKNFSAADYMKYYTEMSKFSGEKKKEDIVNYIKRQTDNTDKQKILYQAAGYSLDSTKNGMTIPDANFNEAFKKKSTEKVEGAAGIEKGITEGSVTGDARYDYVVRQVSSKKYTKNDAVEWFKSDPDRVNSKKYKAWKKAGYSDYDYIKVRADLSQFNGDGKQAAIANYIRDMDDKKRMVIWFDVCEYSQKKWNKYF